MQAKRLFLQAAALLLLLLPCCYAAAGCCYCHNRQGLGFSVLLLFKENYEDYDFYCHALPKPSLRVGPQRCRGLRGTLDVRPTGASGDGKARTCQCRLMRFTMGVAVVIAIANLSSVEKIWDIQTSPLCISERLPFWKLRACKTGRLRPGL